MFLEWPLFYSYIIIQIKLKLNATIVSILWYKSERMRPLLIKVLIDDIFFKWARSACTLLSTPRSPRQKQHSSFQKRNCFLSCSLCTEGDTPMEYSYWRMLPASERSDKDAHVQKLSFNFWYLHFPFKGWMGHTSLSNLWAMFKNWCNFLSFVPKSCLQ